MEVICLEDSAFYTLIEKVVARIKEQSNITEDKWISGSEINIMTNSYNLHIRFIQTINISGILRYSWPHGTINIYLLCIFSKCFSEYGSLVITMTSDKIILQHIRLKAFFNDLFYQLPLEIIAIDKR